MSEASRLRVLRIIARLNMGGPAHHVSLLSGRLEGRGYETRLLHGAVPPGEASLDELPARYGARAEIVPHLSPTLDPSADARALAEIARTIREWRPHIVHTHTAKAGFLGRLATMSVRPRPVVVHTYHGHVLEGYFSPRTEAVYRNLERGAAKLSDRLLGVSQATVDDLVRLGIAPRDRFQVVPVGLNLGPFISATASPEVRTAYRAELGVKDDEVLLSFVGRLAPIKRVDVLLRAVARLRELTGTPFVLAIVGDGTERAGLEQLTRTLGLGDVARFLGYRADMPAVAAGADVAVLSSDNEGTPVSLIEAGAAGKPAVTTDAGGVRDVVTPDGGAVVPPGDHEALARAMVEFVDDAERRRVAGAAARRWVVERFSVDRLVDDVDALYRELLPIAGKHFI